MSPENKASEFNLAPVLALIEQKRKRHGEKYQRFIGAVAALLRAKFPEAFGKMPDDRLSEMIAFVDVVGEDSKAMMKRLKEGCAGCGWCCSQTSGIIVSAEDAERISRELKQKKADLFVFREGVWWIKDAHPCRWWNPRNGRCRIYNIRPQTCRNWPTIDNHDGVACLQPVAECAYAVRVTAVKVLDMLDPAKPR
ncbi:YkgJ family cysteine cluster protein [Dehalogenimonas sp. 4OHTPN]|uniref:YkgJ family cysteine cluster protein n=1 Tax=Dehalogenimonas sp. 4OHTPN TaxID=3166643 RepID=A0AAU8GAX0_9CHLR